MLIPYIDLQLSGIQDTLRVAGTGYINVKAVVILSFFLVALYTFSAELKVPLIRQLLKIFWYGRLCYLWLFLCQLCILEAGAT